MPTKTVKEKASPASKKTSTTSKKASTTSNKVKPTVKKAVPSKKASSSKKVAKSWISHVQGHPLKSLLLCGAAVGLVVKKLLKKNKQKS